MNSCRKSQETLKKTKSLTSDDKNTFKYAPQPIYVKKVFVPLCILYTGQLTFYNRIKYLSSFPSKGPLYPKLSMCTIEVDLVPLVWPTAPPKVRKPRFIAAKRGPFWGYFLDLINFPGQTVDFRLQHVTNIWKAMMTLSYNLVIWNQFQCILWCVRFLLTQCNPIEPQIFNLVTLFLTSFIIQVGLYRLPLSFDGLLMLAISLQSLE